MRVQPHDYIVTLSSLSLCSHGGRRGMYSEVGLTETCLAYLTSLLNVCLQLRGPNYRVSPMKSSLSIIHVYTISDIH